MKLKIKPVALSLGILSAILHFIGVLILISTKGSILNFWQNMHFISIQFNILNFDILTLILGTVIAFIVGSIIGAIFVLIYNYLSK